MVSWGFPCLSLHVSTSYLKKHFTSSFNRIIDKTVLMLDFACIYTQINIDQWKSCKKANMFVKTCMIYEIKLQFYQGLF